jgi:endonuclease-8
LSRSTRCPDRLRHPSRAHQLLVANRDRVEKISTGDRRRSRQLWVYGRRGPCLRCGTPVSRADLGPVGQERPTYW